MSNYVSLSLRVADFIHCCVPILGKMFPDLGICILQYHGKATQGRLGISDKRAMRAGYISKIRPTYVRTLCPIRTRGTRVTKRCYGK